MIHVNGRKRQLSRGPALMQQIEQDHGIHAATERDGDMVPLTACASNTPSTIAASSSFMIIGSQSTITALVRAIGKNDERARRFSAPPLP